MLIAHAPADIQEAALAGPFQQYTSRTITDPRLLRQMFADVRTKGFVVSDRQLSDETVSVAAPVFDGDGQVIAAISLVVRQGTTATRLLVPPLLTSARAITRSLTGPPAPARRHR